MQIDMHIVEGQIIADDLANNRRLPCHLCRQVGAIERSFVETRSFAVEGQRRRRGVERRQSRTIGH